MTQQKIVMQNMIPVSLVENWTILLNLERKKEKNAKNLVRGKNTEFLSNITKLITQITNFESTN